MPDTPVVLPVELVDFLESGVAILVGTRSAELRPLCARAMGARVDRDRSSVTIFLPERSCAGLLANLRDNGRIAVTFARPIDHRSLQIKGTVTAIRPSDGADRSAQEAYRGALMEQLHAVGVSRALSRRLAWWPSVAVDVRVAELFEQTPGPNAGARLAS